MPSLKTLSGKDVVTILSHFGFMKISQRGSHIKMRKVSHQGEKQSITIPLHKELAYGTTRGIYRHLLRYIREEELKPYFFT